MATRAHDDAARLARRNSILQAARSLFLLDPHQLPSAAHIANEAGLAKGTVYLYFRTKEEIFLALLGEEFFGLMQEIESIFADTSTLSIPSFLQRYTAYLEAHPEFLRLDAMTYSVLEQNMSHEVLREFKLALVAQLTKTGAQLDAALQFPAGRGASLLLRTHAITRGLWQSLAYPPALQTLLVDEVFAPIRPDFNSELMTTLGEYWQGALQNSAP